MQISRKQPLEFIVLPSLSLIWDIIELPHQSRVKTREVAEEFLHFSSKFFHFILHYGVQCC